MITALEERRIRVRTHKGTCAKKVLGSPYIIHTYVRRQCLMHAWQLVRKAPTRGWVWGVQSEGSKWSFHFTRQDARRYSLSGGSPTFPWSLLLRQLIFKHDVPSDTARKHITREKIL